MGNLLLTSRDQKHLVYSFPLKELTLLPGSPMLSPKILLKIHPISTFGSWKQKSVKSYVQKKHKGWEPAWSCDEKLLARNLNQELQVYETDKMESIANKMQDVKVADFSLSPGHAPYFFLCYIQGMNYLHKLFYDILISFQFICFA